MPKLPSALLWAADLVAMIGLWDVARALPRAIQGGHLVAVVLYALEGFAFVAALILSPDMFVEWVLAEVKAPARG